MQYNGVNVPTHGGSILILVLTSMELIKYLNVYVICTQLFSAINLSPQAQYIFYLLSSYKPLTFVLKFGMVKKLNFLDSNFTAVLNS